MMALPATCSRPRRWSQRRRLVLARLHPAMQAPAVPPAEFHICRQALPRSRGGLRQMARAGQRVRLTSTCVRFSSASGDGLSFLASQHPT